MNDPPEDAETPIQRALRIKKAAAAAEAKRPRAAGFHRAQQTKVASGKSKPWMKR
ncbi:MAG TPA: hypothetical protein VHX64_13950 [Caulobacteraceae bacterium]|jgi:hypothetical protein|nr:hypothetical protein [Caulobacteraceae bacterium]